MIKELGRKPMGNGSKKQTMGSYTQPDAEAASLKVSLLFKLNDINLSKFKIYLTQLTNEEHSVLPFQLNLPK